MIECEPEASDDVETVATPLAFKATLAPKADAPSKNVAVPVGIPPPGLVTVAVNVTDWPGAEGLTEDTRAVEEDLLTMICVKGLDVLGAYSKLP